MSSRQLVAKMRVRTFDYLPYLGTYVYSLKPQAREGLGTLAVDRHANMYYDPAYIASISLDSGAYAVAHETLHVVLQHHRRARELYGTAPSELLQYAMNVAADLVVEQALACMREHRPPNTIYLGGRSEKLGISLDFPPGLTMEDYYRLITDRMPEGGGGESEGAESGDLDGGSCADGVDRDYEDEPDGAWEAFGETQAAGMADKAIAEAEKSSPGSVPECVKHAVGCKVRVVRDPWAELRAAVATSVASPVGGRDQTYRRLPRKQALGPIRLRGYQTTAPKAVVILDTSYSMLDESTKDKALSCIAAGLRKLARFKVIAGDTEVHSRKHVSNLKQVEWVGGGGTAMDRVIADVDRKDQPDSIIVVTDCETRWPERATRARLVVASTSSNPYWLGAVPTWARTITLAD